jgi:hypothetical protein
MNKLNESLTSEMQTVSQNLPDDATTVVDPTYADAVKTGKNIETELAKRFKDQNKAKDEFVKENQKTELKVKGTKEMKKMKLSEGLFEEVKEEIEKDTLEEAYGDATTPGIGRCAPTFGTYTKDIEAAIAELNNPETASLAERTLKHIEGWLDEQYKDLQAFHAYWLERHEAMEKHILEQRNMITSAIGTSEEVQEEALQEEAPSNIFYRSERESLADIIMAELTSGEDIYLLNDKNKFIPSNAPSLNLDAEEAVGWGYDNKGDFIQAYTPDKETAAQVEAIASKYGKEAVTKYDKYISGASKYITKIYLDDIDWDEPYFDPNVQIRPDGRKRKAA